MGKFIGTFRSFAFERVYIS